MISLHSVIEMFNSTDMSRISDDLTPMQREINLTHNVRNLHKMDARRVTDERIVETSDLQQLGAIAARQL